MLFCGPLLFTIVGNDYVGNDNVGVIRVIAHNFGFYSSQQFYEISIVHKTKFLIEKILPGMELENI